MNFNQLMWFTGVYVTVAVAGQRMEGIRLALYFRPAFNDFQNEQRSQGAVRTSNESYMFPMELDTFGNHQFGR
jgi:quinol-cytochrome oxidoreductase complex cytochrome b subunit